jgi:hypothetical protein
MKYSILGFSQEEVLKCKSIIDANGKEKEVCIDITDLLILQCVADFMNRQNIYKYVINDKMYFSIQYKALLEDLPILNIGKQALRDRMDKLVLFNLLEKEVIKNEQGSFSVFRIGVKYEQLKYKKDENGVCSKIEGGVYQTTHGCVSNYTPKDSSTINSLKNELSFNNLKKENKDNSKKSEDDELFEQLWIAYNRKGNKQNAKKQWVKIPQEDKDNILPHIRAYVDVNETKYTKDFERYLKDKVYKNVVYDKSNNVVYDPEYSTKYTPTGNNLIQWSEKYNVYICSDNFDYYDRNKIRDGYTDQDRPDGATIVLYGGRGTIQWYKETKKWEYIQK